MSINNSRFILVEMPYTTDLGDSEQNLLNVQKLGYVPVIAHPERMDIFQRDPGLLRKFVCNGMLTQITSGSLIGKFAWQLHARQQLDKYANKLEIANTQNEQLVSLCTSLNEKIGESALGHGALLQAAELRSETLAGILPLKARFDTALNELAESQAQCDAHGIYVP